MLCFKESKYINEIVDELFREGLGIYLLFIYYLFTQLFMLFIKTLFTVDT